MAMLRIILVYDVYNGNHNVIGVANSYKAAIDCILTNGYNFFICRDEAYDICTPATDEEIKDIYNQIGMNLDEMLTPRKYNYIPKEEYDDVYRIDVNNQYSQSEEDTLSR